VRIFLDTNVLASASGTHGLCRQLMKRVLAKHELLSSETVITELERVLATKFGLPRPEVDLALAMVRTTTVLPEPVRETMPTLSDPEDKPIIAAAISGRADLFITGDQALLELGEIEGLTIRSPREAWGRVAAND
jgi:putative PIN family toxin of toxin-antitoxin system